MRSDLAYGNVCALDARLNEAAQNDRPRQKLARLKNGEYGFPRGPRVTLFDRGRTWGRDSSAAPRRRDAGGGGPQPIRADPPSDGVLQRVRIRGKTDYGRRFSGNSLPSNYSSTSWAGPAESRFDEKLAKLRYHRLLAVRTQLWCLAAAEFRRFGLTTRRKRLMIICHWHIVILCKRWSKPRCT